MYYLQSRYYDSTVGRFVNADSAEYVSIQGGNLFAYCGDCPTNNADYFGFCYVPTVDEKYTYTSPSSVSYIYRSDGEDGILVLVLKSIAMICMVVVSLLVIPIKDIITLINESKWLSCVLDVLEIALPGLAGLIGAPWLATAGIVIGVISLIAAIFNKDNTIFDWFGIGFEIINYIKKKKWKEVVGAIFSYFDEILAFLKKVL